LQKKVPYLFEFCDDPDITYAYKNKGNKDFSNPQLIQALKVARRVQEAFKSNYLDKVQAVKLTKDNASKILFSVCSIHPIDN
jgi:hypothetical protein